jgi:hypothetical protein
MIFLYKLAYIYVRLARESDMHMVVGRWNKLASWHMLACGPENDTHPTQAYHGTKTRIFCRDRNHFSIGFGCLAAISKRGIRIPPLTDHAGTPGSQSNTCPYCPLWCALLITANHFVLMRLITISKWAKNLLDAYVIAAWWWLTSRAASNWSWPLGHSLIPSG